MSHPHAIPIPCTLSHCPIATTYVSAFPAVERDRALLQAIHCSPSDDASKTAETSSLIAAPHSPDHSGSCVDSRLAIFGCATPRQYNSMTSC